MQVGSHVVKAVPAPSARRRGRGSHRGHPPGGDCLGTKAGSDGVNEFVGTIAEATFLGNIVDYFVDIGGVALRVQGDRRDLREIGTRVCLSIPVAECVAMSAGAPAAGEPAKDPDPLS